MATKTIALADDTIDILFAVDICWVARVVSVPHRKMRARQAELPYTWQEYFAKIGDFPMEAISQGRWSPNIPSVPGVYRATVDYFHEGPCQTSTLESAGTILSFAILKRLLQRNDRKASLRLHIIAPLSQCEPVPRLQNDT